MKILKLLSLLLLVVFEGTAHAFDPVSLAAAIGGTAAVAGGIASLFGKKKKKVGVTAPVPTAEKIQPEATALVREQVQGRKVGLPPGSLTDLEMGIQGLSTQSIKDAIRASATGLSGAGLGRSSLKGAQAGDITLRGGLDTAARIGALRLRGAELAREDINRSTDRALGLARTEQARAAGGATTQQAANIAQAELDTARDKSILDTIGGFGIAALSGGAKTETEILIDEILKRRNAAEVKRA